MNGPGRDAGRVCDGSEQVSSFFFFSFSLFLFFLSRSLLFTRRGRCHDTIPTHTYLYVTVASRDTKLIAFETPSVFLNSIHFRY